MLVEFGNPRPINPDGTPVEGRPAVTRLSIPNDRTCEPGADVRDMLVHLARTPGTTSHLPDQEAVVEVFYTMQSHIDGAPAWVWSDNDVLADYLGEMFDCPVGRPDNVEMTHFTLAGPPGVGPQVAPDAEDEA